MYKKMYKTLKHEEEQRRDQSDETNGGPWNT